MNSEVKDLKAQIFDILVAQENLKNQINQLDQVKQDKLKELQEVLKNSDKTPTESPEKKDE